MFANQEKRKAVNYEDDLAAYTSSGVSPTSTSYPPSFKKRRGDATGVSFSSSEEQRRSSASSLASSSSSASSLSPFAQQQRSQWQQHLEALQADFRAKLRSLKDSNSNSNSNSHSNSNNNMVRDVHLTTAEFRRIYRLLQARFQPLTGDVMACGSDDVGALGVAETADDDKLDDYPPTLCRIPSGQGGQGSQGGQRQGQVQGSIVMVKAGGMHSMMLDDQGRAYTVGANDDRALGRQNIKEEEIHLAGQVSYPAPIVAIDGGDSHTIALDVNGKVYIHGTMKDVDSGKFINQKPGEHLQGKENYQELPIQVPFDKPVWKIVAGISTNAAIDASANLYTWGMGHAGDLARSKSMGAPLIKVMGENGQPTGEYTYDIGKTFIGNIVKEKKLVKDDEGNIKEKQVESYTYDLPLIESKFLTPSLVEWEFPKQKYTVCDVSLGDVHMLVLAQVPGGGPMRVFSSGHNNYGQLGHGDLKARHCLTQIKAFDDKIIHGAEAGAFHSLFLDAEGINMYACGRSDYGQLGIFDEKEKLSGGCEKTPVPVPMPAHIDDLRISKIVAGASCSMAIMTNGDVFSFGFNVYGQTGHSVKIRRRSEDVERPQKVNLMRKYIKSGNKQMGTTANVIDAACGAQHSLFLVNRYI